MNCARRGLECEYAQWTELLTPGGFGNSTLQQTNISRSPESSTTHSQCFRLEDLGLIHHFAMHTSKTMSAIGSDENTFIWQCDVPKLATSQPALMHALLAFAAAHQASDADKSTTIEDKMQVARRHYSQALVFFRGSVKDLTAERPDVLYCYCILVCFLTLFFEFDIPVEEQDPIEDFVSLLEILHTSIGVLDLVEGPLMSTAVGKLLQHRQDRKTHSIAADAEQSLGTLEALIVGQSGQPGFDDATVACLNDAVLMLRQVFAWIEPNPSSWAHLLSWPINLGPAFGKLVQQRHPAALCTICHWFVPAYHAPRKWYVGDWPARAIVAISNRLSEVGSWEAGVAWPRNVIQSR